MPDIWAEVPRDMVERFTVFQFQAKILKQQDSDLMEEAYEELCYDLLIDLIPEKMRNHMTWYHVLEMKPCLDWLLTDSGNLDGYVWNNTIYRMPNEMLTNVSCAEIEFTYGIIARYQNSIHYAKKPHTQAFYMAVASFFRPQLADLDEDSESYDGEPRVALNGKMVQGPYLSVIKEMPPSVVMHCYQWYMTQLGRLFTDKRFSKVFEKQKERGAKDAAKEKKPYKMNPMMIKELLMLSAEMGVLGTYQDIQKMSFFSLLMNRQSYLANGERREKKNKKKK